jgi:hypothetical protein
MKSFHLSPHSITDFVGYIGGAPSIEEEYMLNYILELVESGQ